MNTQPKNLKARKGQQGNVLFLILIAVALFAALSYAVTQSTRSGGGDASNEKSLVSSAAMTQYPAAIKTSILRMTVSNGVDLANLNFVKPADSTNYNALVPTATATSSTAPELRTTNAVFHPEGGGATYSNAPKDSVTTGTGAWVFNGRNEVRNIGTTVAASATAATASTADYIALLDNVTKGICDKVHDQLGISKTYDTITTIDYTNKDNTSASTFGFTAGGVIGSASASPLAGQPQGCFFVSGTRYVYYHVLVEK